MLTHPDKPLFDDPPLTKADLAGYYRDVAPQLLREAGRRPLTVVRCPDGIDAGCFVQKHVGSGVPDSVHTLRIAERSGDVDDYLWVDDADGLEGLVQLGGIELHAWGARIDDVEHADRLVFDLDPATDVAWDAVREAARTLREHLADAGLESFLRTTGGKGLHVVVPLRPAVDWEDAKRFARGVAEHLSAEQPDRFLSSAAKSERGGRIFIDYLRNARGATAIVNYAVRARAGAPVAAPLRWDELGRLESAGAYTVGTVRRRLAQLDADPWAGIDDLHQALPGNASD